jgi:plasmid maintenance system antidote protein VapI
MAKTTKKPAVKKGKAKIAGNNIKKILEEINMPQVELADLALDGNTAHLSRIINGQRKCISLPIAMEISKVLGRPVEEVFIYAGNKTTKRL